jgi:predicted phosphodiesterase
MGLVGSVSLYNCRANQTRQHEVWHKGLRISDIHGGRVFSKADEILFLMDAEKYASLIVSNRENPQPATVKVRLRGPGLKPEMVFTKYGSREKGVSMRQSAIDEVLVTYRLRANKYGLIAIEPPLTGQDHYNYKTGNIKVQVSGGAILDGRDTLLFVRSFGDNTLINLANSGPREQRLTITIDNLAKDARIDISGLSQQSTKMPKGLHRFTVVVPAQGKGQIKASKSNIKYPLRLLVGGDIRKGVRTFSGLLKKVKANFPSPDLFFLTGDYTDQGLPHEYGPFFKALDTLDVPNVFSIGNHDKRSQGSLHYAKKFGPKRMAVPYGPLFIVTFDTTNYTVSDADFAWLDQQLSASKANYKIIGIHVPVHKLHLKNNFSKEVSDKLHALAVKHKVKYVLSGHVHMYARAEIDGVTYLSSGGGGAPNFGYQCDPRFTFKFDKHLMLLTFFADHVEETFIPFVDHL